MPLIALGRHQSAVRAWAEALLVNVASVSMPQDGRPLAAFTLLAWDRGAWSARQYRVPYDAVDEARALAVSGIPGD